MNIAILGGGVGGLASAIALGQKGHTVTVYERHREPSHIGAGIVCWPNASFVLERIGLLDRVCKRAGRPRAMQRLSDEGEALGSVDIRRLDTLMGYPSFSILRADLMDLLATHALRQGIEIHYARQARTLKSTTANQAIAHLGTGAPIQADLIIGADGRMNSPSRHFVNGDNRPVFQGFINWVGVFENDRPIFDDIAVRDYWGIGERFGIVPITPYKAYWAGGAAARITNAGVDVKRELLMHFQGWPDPIADIISGTPAARIKKIHVHDHDPIETWHKDNVLLIGDAAHAPLPTSGQGACQALEDAWHLAEVLDEHPTNLQAGLSAFTTIRRAKTRGITLGARQLAGALFDTDPKRCLHRNVRSKATDYDAMVRGMAMAWSEGLPGESGGTQ